MADKIDEIMESGHLRKLDHIGEAVPVLELFTNIWGAGAKTAQLWYQQVKTQPTASAMSFLCNTNGGAFIPNFGIYGAAPVPAGKQDI